MFSHTSMQPVWMKIKNTGRECLSDYSPSVLVALFYQDNPVSINTDFQVRLKPWKRDLGAYSDERPTCKLTITFT